VTDYLCLKLGHDCQLSFSQTHKDYDGNTHRPVWEVERAKGLGYRREQDFIFADQKSPAPSPLMLWDMNILIPCTRHATSRILDFLQSQHLMAKYDPETGRMPNMYGPYYFTVAMEGESELEGPDSGLNLLGGPDTAYATALGPNKLSQLYSWLTGAHKLQENKPDEERNMGYRNPHNIPYARYNCWTATQGITQYVGGIDLAHIDPRFTEVFRAAKAVKTFEKLTKRLSDRHNGHYRCHTVDDTVTLAQRHDGPPFILVHQMQSLDELLEKPIEGIDKTVEKWLDAQKTFMPKPLERHEYKQKKDGWLKMVMG
jgi:hypothetical protein